MNNTEDNDTTVGREKPLGNTPPWQEKLLAYIPTYLQQRRGDYQNLIQAYAEIDWEKIHHIGHKIKGSAATFGFPELGEIGAEFERAATTRDLGKIQSNMLKFAAWLEAH